MSEKTNAIRLLDQGKIPHDTFTYDAQDGFVDGVSVAEKIGKPVTHVFKTLVTQSGLGHYYVFVVPVHQELDLKKAAKAAGAKFIEMIPSKDITKITGYIKGGCSPLAMKKHYPTFIDVSALSIEQIVVSAGKIGLQMAMSPEALIEISQAKTADLVKEA